MQKIVLLISLLILTNCAYKPKINPETSRDKWSGENIAGKYYKDLATCDYIWENESSWSLIERRGFFIRKCMKSYGYDVLW